MAKINDAEVAIDSDLVTHLQRMTIELAKLIVDIDFEAITTHHAHLTQAHCRDRRVRCGTATSRQQTIAVEDHTDVVGNGVGSDWH